MNFPGNSHAFSLEIYHLGVAGFRLDAGGHQSVDPTDSRKANPESEDVYRFQYHRSPFLILWVFP